MNLFKNLLTKQFVYIVGSLRGTVKYFIINEPVVALTFDDGPHPQYTPELLKILDKSNVKATFFLIGEEAQRHRDLVEKVFRAGHVIGNHSWNHPSFTAITGKKRRRQILACQRAVAPFGQRIFRPPWGNQSIGLLLDAMILRYQIIGWNLEVGDWWDKDSSRMANLLTSGIRPGRIILLHDSIVCGQGKEDEPTPYVERGAMLSALDNFLKRARHRFRFATIPQMFQLGRPIRIK